MDRRRPFVLVMLVIVLISAPLYAVQLGEGNSFSVSFKSTEVDYGAVILTTDRLVRGQYYTLSAGEEVVRLLLSGPRTVKNIMQ